MRLRITVAAWRGEIPESRHHVQVAVCDAAGRAVAGSEAAGWVTSFRSSAKPFQLLPLVERGHARRWGLSDEELAVMAASHTGSAYHVALVAGILYRLGLDDGHLACGFHEPLDAESLAQVRRPGATRTPLYNNCSGKHAGMLCLAVAEGLPVAGYERPEHPVQRMVRAAVAGVCDQPEDGILDGTDGCSLPTFGLPLPSMATAYARLASARPDRGAREAALSRIRSAMIAHPRAVGGDGRLSTTLMLVGAGAIVAKGGAEGLECIGLIGGGLGVALKCEDGQARALAPAAVAVLRELGELTEADLLDLESVRRPVLRNHGGLAVGRLEATIERLPPGVEASS